MSRPQEQPDHGKHAMKEVVNLSRFAYWWFADFGMPDHQVVADEV
jgi:hypothetical protein